VNVPLKCAAFGCARRATPTGVYCTQCAATVAAVPDGRPSLATSLWYWLLATVNVWVCLLGAANEHYFVAALCGVTAVWLLTRMIRTIP
jgi:hypothetical protein